MGSGPCRYQAKEHVGALDRLRIIFLWKADGLDPAGLRTRVGVSSLTLGGLLRHLAAVEDHVFTAKRPRRPMAVTPVCAGSSAT